MEFRRVLFRSFLGIAAPFGAACVWGMWALDTDREEGPVRRGGDTVPDGGVKRPRRSQGERSEEMRERVAQATFEVIAVRGFSGLRPAAVAEQAGVSQGEAGGAREREREG